MTSSQSGLPILLTSQYIKFNHMKPVHVLKRVLGLCGFVHGFMNSIIRATVNGGNRNGNGNGKGSSKLHATITLQLAPRVLYTASHMHYYEMQLKSLSNKNCGFAIIT